MKVDAIKCPLCEDVIWSRHRHDFRSCSCGALSIDGGRDYTRYLWDDKKVECPKIIEIEVELENGWK